VSASRDELDRIADRTLAHYDASAESFWQGTRDHDVRQNIAALLRHLEGPGPFAILDLGCGPGRDLIALSALGHMVTGLEGSATRLRVVEPDEDPTHGGQSTRSRSPRTRASVPETAARCGRPTPGSDAGVCQAPPPRFDPDARLKLRLACRG